MTQDEDEYITTEPKNYTENDMFATLEVSTYFKLLLQNVMFYIPLNKTP